MLIRLHSVSYDTPSLPADCATGYNRNAKNDFFTLLKEWDQFLAGVGESNYHPEALDAFKRFLQFDLTN